MTAHVITYNGKQDGIRFGHLRFGAAKRCYTYDRLNGTIILYIEAAGDCALLDDDPTRLEQALKAVLAHESEAA